MHVREDPHFGIGESAAESAGGVEIEWNGDRRFDDKIAVALASKVENASLAGEESSFGRGNNRCETGVAPGFDALVGERSFIGSATPRSRTRTIFRSARGRLATSTATTALATAFGRAGGRHSDVGERVKETGINCQPLAFDDERISGDGNILASDGKNHATCDDDGGVFHHRSRNGDNFCSANCEVLRLAALRGGEGRPRERG